MNTGFGQAAEMIVKDGVSGDIIVGHHFSAPGYSGPQNFAEGGFFRFSTGAGYQVMLHCTGEQSDPGDPYYLYPHRLIWYYDPPSGLNWEGGVGPMYDYQWDYGEWGYLEHKISSSGLQMKRDGSTVLTGPGRTSSRVEHRYQNFGFERLYTDNIYALDTGGGFNNDFLGECRVITLWGTYYGSPNNMVPSHASASVFAEPWNSFPVDHHSRFLADNVSQGSLRWLVGSGGQSEWFSLEIPYAFGESIRGIQVSTYWKGNGNGDGTGTQGVKVDGLIYYPSVYSYANILDDGAWHGSASIFELNPKTSAPWTWEDIFELQIGAVSATGENRLYHMSCEILVSGAESAASLYQAR
jgi:hypothetical protein